MTIIILYISYHHVTCRNNVISRFTLSIQINFIYTSGVGAAAQLFGLDLDGSDLLLGEGGADFRTARAMHDLCYCILSLQD